MTLVLVDVDPDGVDPGGTCGVDDALASEVTGTGQTGGLEQNVNLGVVIQESCCGCLAGRLIGKTNDEVRWRDERCLDLNGWVDRSCAQDVSLHVPDTRPAKGDAADGADDLGLGCRRGDDAGEVTGLILGVLDGDVLRKQRRNVACAVFAEL